MRSLTYDQCFDRLIGAEGGYVNDPNDAGGETKWGISKRSYPYLDIANLTRDDAKVIYFNDFWKPVTKGLEVPESVLFQLFDFAVNSGIDAAICAFQRSIGTGDDGIWGPVSRTAAAKFAESDLLMLLLAARLEFMTNCRTWKHHGRGWARRIADNLRYAALDNEV